MSTPKPPENLHVCRDQSQLYVCQACQMALRKCLNRTSHHTKRRKARPNPTSLLRIPEKTKLISRLNEKMNRDHAPESQQRHSQVNEKCDPDHLDDTQDNEEVDENDSK